ncbi:hypothetical protein IPM62_00455 [Candidatus Woesebacteria bacterium]|nr:MAG: hypothetical protein IPM62_00455 [Candidatus Woesebacteria bacterium]
MMNILTGLVLAGDGSGQVSLDAPAGFSNLQSVSFGAVIEWAIAVVLVLASVIFFFMLVLGGIKWITSGGDKGKTEAARNQITAALVGLIIVFASWAILQLVNLVFGVDIISNLTIPPLNAE